MKNIIMLVVGAGMLGLTGCGMRFTSYVSPLDPFLQSKLPPDPVRNSESYLRLGNSYDFQHRQGTINYATRTWSPHMVDEKVGQKTFNDTSLRISPPHPYIPVIVDAPFTHPQSSGNVRGNGVFSGSAGRVLQ